MDSIIRSFDLLGLSGHIPLKLGHEGPDARDEPASQFALGWVTRVYREGKKLLADFDVPEKVASWIKEGFLRFVSVELLRDVKADTREIPWVLDAVALLGADQPAVGILKSLSLTMARSTALQFRARVAFTRDNTSLNGGRKANMADENKDVSALMARLDAIEKERDGLKLKAAESESFQRKLTDLEAATRSEKIAAHRTSITNLFESAIKDKKILPAVRERFKRLYKFDEDAIINVPTTDVETFIRENPNPEAPAKGASFSSNGEHISPDARVDERVLFAAKKLADGAQFRNMPRWEQLLRATQQVLQNDPEMASAYKHMPESVG